MNYIFSRQITQNGCSSTEILQAKSSRGSNSGKDVETLRGMATSDAKDVLFVRDTRVREDLILYEKDILQFSFSKKS